MSKSDAGKGDDPRPMSVTKKEFDRRFEKTFHGKEKDEKEDKDERPVRSP